VQHVVLPLVEEAHIELLSSLTESALDCWLPSVNLPPHLNLGLIALTAWNFFTRYLTTDVGPEEVLVEARVPAFEG
jgi:hypothetical protein